DKANPMAAIGATKMMLDWLGRKHNDQNLLLASEKVEEAVVAVLEEGKTLTYDLGGDAKCSEVGTAIAEKMKSLQ
ncbi:MAG: isocitrate/isopropylmalate dehydrogenase family protein, partial [Thermoplasmata archaeon]|nr:isocitrate/isopropylmalate dehydrogenase family protein [Thermoplasmata archaeon]